MYDVIMQSLIIILVCLIVVFSFFYVVLKKIDKRLSEILQELKEKNKKQHSENKK